MWVSPSTVDRVLAAHGLILPGRPRPPRSRRQPWPDWVTYQPNEVWGYDATHFGRCRATPVCFAVIDLISRKWIHSLLTPDETAVEVKVVFRRALRAEGLWDQIVDRWDTIGPAAADLDDDAVPILLAVSDNGPAMRAEATRAFMIRCSIAQHFGRPHTPTDQAPIESLFGHIKGEYPHLCRISDPAVLWPELERVRAEYNTVRLHEAIGYVTPDDEHHGRGDAIRRARRDGLQRARTQRINHNRQQQPTTTPGGPQDAV